MTDYTAFFLNGPSRVIAFDTFEISHSEFSQTYRIVRNKTDGLTATLETSAEVTFDYYPVSLTRPDKNDTLDQVLTIQFGDLGEILPTEIDRVYNADAMDEKPLIKYRAFRSDDLSAPMLGPLEFQVEGVAHTKSGAGLRAAAKRLQRFGTGLAYTFDRFDTLKGFAR